MNGRWYVSFTRFYENIEVLLSEAELRIFPNGPDDNVTAGLWQRGIPQATWKGWSNAQPAADHSPSGVRCFVTGPLAGQNYWDHDVDGGKTTLFSPVYDLSNMQELIIRYFKWYKNNTAQNPNQDF